MPEQPTQNGLEKVREVAAAYRSEFFKSQRPRKYVDLGNGTFKAVEDYTHEEIDNFLNRVETVAYNKDDKPIALTIEDLPLFIYWLKSGFVNVYQSQIYKSLIPFLHEISNPSQRIVYCQLCLNLIKEKTNTTLNDDTQLVDTIMAVIAELELTENSKVEELINIMHERIIQYRNERESKFISWIKRNALGKKPVEINLEQYLFLIHKIQTVLTQENNRDYDSIKEIVSLLKQNDLKGLGTNLTVVANKVEEVQDSSMDEVLRTWLAHEEKNVISDYLDKKYGDEFREKLVSLHEQSVSLSIKIRSISVLSGQEEKSKKEHDKLNKELKKVEKELSKLREQVEKDIRNVVKLEK